VRWRVDVGPFRWADPDETEWRREALGVAGAGIKTTDEGDVVSITVSASTENDARLRAAWIFQTAVWLDFDIFNGGVPISIEALPDTPTEAKELDEALKLLDSRSYQERIEGVRRLSALDDPRALEGLTRALYDSDDTAVIEAAAESLLERFDSFSMGALADAMKSDNFDVTQTVSDVLYMAAARGRFADELLNRPD
jgi:HEAT repeat protein